MAVRGIGSATVSPTISFSCPISFITRTTSAIFIPSGTTPTAAMISAGSSTSISKCMTTLDVPHDCNHCRTASLFSRTSSGVRCWMPYRSCLALISSRSQSRNPTKGFWKGLSSSAVQKQAVCRPTPCRLLPPWHDSPHRYRLAR